jgi:hypothetical protein
VPLQSSVQPAEVASAAGKADAEVVSAQTCSVAPAGAVPRSASNASGCAAVAAAMNTSASVATGCSAGSSVASAATRQASTPAHVDTPAQLWRTATGAGASAALRHSP